jgi:hypothetical protein
MSGSFSFERLGVEMFKEQEERVRKEGVYTKQNKSLESLYTDFREGGRIAQMDF